MLLQSQFNIALAILKAHATMDFIICSLGFSSFAGYVSAATPFFVFISALFSCVLFGLRVYVTVRDFKKKSKNPNSYVNGGDDYSQKEIEK